ncbi:hypothetical protein HNQ51_003743 [Inhella inkyongensis]|uniref:TOD1/MUCI70 glycosyltransferase-like domain-containing protein n=1 Tax=Inhella inkyongensis TaxID=392593 RepID=A0A840S4Z9_9BURK|nr:glycosyltransferase domain-containing protein [Inhella inkyongensis]MBB5206397.1 hypothetical protein [Inhella inkyongensis]
MAKKIKLVVYTVLTGGKEALGDPLEGLSPEQLQTDLDIDWVCFTDRPEQPSSRCKMRPLQEPLPPERSSRRPKMLPHLYLEEWEYSLYIDNIVRFARLPTRAELLGESVDGPLLRSFRHSTRRDPATEAEAIVQLGYETVPALTQQLDYYRAQGWLEGLGELSTCTLILRRHHDPALRRLGEIWWEQFLLFGKRDQMSFDVARRLAGVAISHWPGLKNDCPWLVNTGNLGPHRVLANFDATRYRWRYRDDPEAQADPRAHYLRVGRDDGRNHARRLELLEWLSWRHGASLGRALAPRRDIAQTLDDWLLPRRMQGGRALVIGVHDHGSQDAARYSDEEINAASVVLSAYLGAWEGARFDIAAAELARDQQRLNDSEGRFGVVVALGCPGPLVIQLLRLVSEALVTEQGLLIVATSSPIPTPLLPATETLMAGLLGATVQAAVQGSQHDSLDAPLRNSLLALAWQKNPAATNPADKPPAPSQSQPAPSPQTMSKPSGERLIIAYCTSGLGNRLRPLASAMAYAQASGRKLRVYWDDVTPNGCLTPWKDLFTTAIDPISLDEIAALDPTRLALFTEKGPGHGVEREALRHERPQLLNLHRAGARLNGAQALTLDEAADIVLVYDNDYLHHLPKQVSVDALRQLNPHPAIRAKVMATAAGLGLKPATPAVHARGTDFNMKEALATYSALIDERIPGGEFFLSTEDAALEAGLRERYGARLKSRPDRLHLQLKEGKTSWSDPDSYTITREHGIDALVDIYLLSSVELVVYHPGSTFAEIARHLHGLLQGLPAPQVAWD